MGAAALSLFLAIPGLANATPITRTYDFEAIGLVGQNFPPGTYSPGPIDPVFGSMTATFDPDGPDILNSLNGGGPINVLVSSPTGFNYDSGLDVLTFGGLGTGVAGSDIADFVLKIGEASTKAPIFLSLNYNDKREFWIADSGSVSLQTLAEPVSLVLVALGLLLLWCCSRHGRQRRPPVSEADQGMGAARNHRTGLSATWRRLRRNPRAALSVVLLAIGLTAPQPANSTLITRTYDFEATGLRNLFFDPSIFPPTDPVFGFVTVSFDPLGPDVLDQLALDGSINVNVVSPIGFNYDASDDILTIGGISFGVAGSDLSDFVLRFGKASTGQPEFIRLGYNVRLEAWVADRGSVTLRALPEPGSLVLTALGLLLLLWHTRGRRSLND